MWLSDLIQYIKRFIKTLVMVLIIKFGRRKKTKLEKLGNAAAESPQVLPVSISNNSYYFEGSSSDGTAIFIRLAFRGSGDCETWLGIRVPGHDDLIKYQNHTLQAKEYCVGDYKAPLLTTGPLKIRCISPMQHWQVVFDDVGNCQGQGAAAQKRFGVSFTLDWHTRSSMWQMDKIDPWPIARCLADKEWSREFFEKRKAVHQTHYEQFGNLKGVIEITDMSDGKKSEHMIDVCGMRDHSFGPRDWSYVNRWAIVFGTFKDGRSFLITLVDTPGLKHLYFGYIQTPGDGFSTPKGFVGITDMKEQIEDFGDDGIPPAKFSLQIKPVGCPWMNLSCHVRDRFIFNVAEGVVLFEQFANFVLKSPTDATSGEGIAEFQYSLKQYPEAKHVTELSGKSEMVPFQY